MLLSQVRYCLQTNNEASSSTPQQQFFPQIQPQNYFHHLQISPPPQYLIRWLDDVFVQIKTPMSKNSLHQLSNSTCCSSVQNTALTQFQTVITLTIDSILMIKIVFLMQVFGMFYCYWGVDDVRQWYEFFCKDFDVIQAWNAQFCGWNEYFDFIKRWLIASIVIFPFFLSAG